MDDDPAVRQETRTSSAPPQNTHNHDANNYDPSCIFCIILSTYPPISPLTPTHPSFDPNLLSPPAYILLSTPHLIAFLDIAPLTRGHILLVPRRHRTKIGHLPPREAAALARLLPLVTRAVTASVLPDLHHDDADYNVVQNNGPGAAQVVPHVHFHVIPRPPLGYQLPVSVSSSAAKTQVRRKYAPAQVPTGLKASFVQFGRGQRSELDDEDAEELVKVMRENVRKEWIREFGESDDGIGKYADEKGKL